MKVIRVGYNFGGRSPDGKGADSELEDLEALSGELGLVVGGVGDVKRLWAVPRRHGSTGVLQRDGDAVGIGDVGLQLL